SRCVRFGMVAPSGISMHHAARIALISIVLAPSLAWSAEPQIGDPAPVLTVAEFIKGDAVDRFEKGKIYVVDFWASWGPPCKESIPRLSELQQKCASVVFIGVSVRDRNAV